MSENYRRQDYSRYKFQLKERLRYILEGLLLVGIISYFFYRSLIIAILLSPLITLYLAEKKQFLCRKRKEELHIQFKDAVKSINGSLQAGYSMENAFSECYGDMVEYHGAESMIAKELFLIKVGIRNNVSIEELVEDLGNRSGIDDISDFAGILRIGKQSGGNLPTLFENSVMVIEEKIAVKEEIQILISAKKLESNIMSLIPFGIIFYIDFTSKGYFDGLYEGIAGRILMSICLLVYGAAVMLSRKITEIEV